MAKPPEKFGLSLRGIPDEAAPVELKLFNRYLERLREEYPEKKDCLPCGEIVIGNSFIFYPVSGQIGVSSRVGPLPDFLNSLKSGVRQAVGIQETKDVMATPDRNYYRLETEMPISASERRLMEDLNRAAAEVAGVAVKELPIVPIVSGMDHADAFKYTVQYPHRVPRVASDHFMVMLNGAAREMGVLERYHALATAEAG